MGSAVAATEGKQAGRETILATLMDIAKGGHLFSYFNPKQFVSSLFSVFHVVCSALQVRFAALYLYTKTWLHSFIVAYTVGCSRGRHTTASMIGNLCLGISPWLDPPPEIAGLVLSRLPSHDDRLSFRFVCRNWRLAAQHQRSLVPPAIPCIILGNGTYQSIADDESKVRHFDTPKDCIASVSFGSWLLYQHKGSGRCFLRALNSPVIDVPCLYLRRGAIHYPYKTTNTVDMGTGIKIVVCSSRLVVAIFRRHKIMAPLSNRRVSRYSNIACFQPAQQLPPTWSPLLRHDHYCPRDGYKDIAFYHGKIFALTSLEELFCYDLFANDGENQQQIRDPLVKHAIEERPALSNNSYLVVSSDKKKLLMVRWNRSITDDCRPAMDLQVFEADFDEGQWSEVKDLAGQVLFLSWICSKAFTAGLLEHCNLGFPRGNCVFVLGNEWAESWRHHAICANHTPSYCVYDMVSGNTSVISLDRAHYIGSFRSGWFFPCE
ncbi:hypothetical protein ACQ4PT_069765 [Festuca glaucescens]